MEKRLLQVGDAFYVSSYGELSRYVISRVTEKRAYHGIGDNEYCFRREISADGTLAPVPNDSWAPKYSIETPELQVKYARQLLTSRASSLMREIRIYSMNTEQLEKLIEALTPFAK